MIRIDELNIDVEDLEEFEDRASEILEEFCNNLESSETTYAPSEDDWVARECGFAYYWTPQAAKTIEVEYRRLYSIGVKYFGTKEVIEINTRCFMKP